MSAPAPAPPAAEPLLVLDDLHVFYGAIHALKGVSLEVRSGEVVTLIGANGAGKSTTLRAISGLARPRSGRMAFDAGDIRPIVQRLSRQRGGALLQVGERIVVP